MPSLHRLLLRSALLATVLAAGPVALAPSAWSGLGFGPSPASAQEGEEPTDDTGFRARIEAPKAAPPGTPVDVIVHLDVLEGHYTYADRTSLELAEGTKGVRLEKVSLPEAKKKFDKFENAEVPIYAAGSHAVRATVVFEKAGRTTLPLVLGSQACTEAYCLFPGSLPVEAVVDVRDGAVAAAVVATAPPPGTPAATPEDATTAPADPDVAAVAANAGEPAASSGSIFSDEKRMAALIRDHFLMALGIAFLGGLLISGTPCVYPMIPITISVIGAQSASSRWRGFFLSLVYVGGITVVYSLLGLVAALSHREFGFLLQSPWVRLGIAAVFAALAASMFGAFSIQLPSSMQTKLLGYQGSGPIGVFVTGLFAGVVAGPCTAPVLLGILVAISSGAVGPMGGLLLMASFSLGMGVLFVVLGTFSGMLAALPKSGVWMENVKHFFGLLLAGGALYYLELAVPGWLFAIALGASLVLFGVWLGTLTRLPPEAAGSARVKQGVGALALAAGLYFFLGGLATSGWGPSWLPSGGGSLPVASAANGSHGEIAWIPDEPTGRNQARDRGQLMVIDFYADWCAACKELDEYTYTDPRVIAKANGFVPVKVDTTERLSTTAEQKAAIAEAKKRYDVRGLPKVVFVTPDGRTLEDLSITGFVPADVFLERLAKAEAAAAERTAGKRAER